MTNNTDKVADTADVDSMLQVLREIGRERIEPLATEVDRSQVFSPELWSVLSELGIASVPFPSEHGGLDGTFVTFVRVIEELATLGGVAALYISPTVQVASAILRFGTSDQITRWAEPLISGQKMASWAFTEPGTGSDPKQISTRAERDGDGWVLNGQKMFISFAPYADTALVYARTSPDRLGAFLVDTHAGGWQPGTPVKTLAMGGQGTGPVWLEDVHVPADGLLGDVHGGFDIMTAVEAEGKVRASAMCVGMGRRALEEAIKYASTRLHRGVPIGEKFPTIQALIGQMSAEVDAARQMVYVAAAAVADQSPDVKRLAASARIVSSRMVREVTSNALQVCGAYGFTQDMVLERLYREGKFYEVGQGVIELQRIIVGKWRLREYASAG
jgi:alkylation response protein AidB-like acyl-CoA dehydrogenase